MGGPIHLPSRVGFLILSHFLWRLWNLLGLTRGTYVVRTHARAEVFIIDGVRPTSDVQLGRCLLQINNGRETCVHIVSVSVSVLFTERRFS